MRGVKSAIPKYVKIVSTNGCVLHQHRMNVPQERRLFVHYAKTDELNSIFGLAIRIQEAFPRGSKTEYDSSKVQLKRRKA